MFPDVMQSAPSFPVSMISIVPAASLLRRSPKVTGILDKTVCGLDYSLSVMSY